jgi:uncharacterized membrane protein YcaP (DUF421 family)
MKPEDIQITDFMRIIQGEAPWSFLIEVVIRIFFIYFLLMFSMRLMGKRMSSALNRNELAALVSLAAAVGVPLQTPDKGLLPAVIICIVIVGIQRGIAYLIYGNKKLETITQGQISILVENGKLKLEDMKKCLITPERLFSQLRSQGIDNLGKVQRVYMENNGNFSIIQYGDSNPGLSLIPEWDHDYIPEESYIAGVFVCSRCGKIEHTSKSPDYNCPDCKEKKWSEAVK